MIGKQTAGALGLAALLLAMGASGCGTSREDAAVERSAPTYGSAAKSEFGTNENGAVARDSAPLHNAARQPGSQRSVVRQGVLTVEVESLDKAEKAMKESVVSHGGYIDHEEGSNLAGEEPVMTLTIRVPEPSFEQMLAGFESLGHRTQKSISASDLTEQILDVQAQVKALKQTGSANEFGTGSSQLKNLESEQLRLSSQAAMSTIDLTLLQKPNAGFSTAAHANWGGDTWNAAVSSAMGAFRVVGAIAIWLLVYSPIWGGVVILAILTARGMKKGNKAQTA